MKTVIPSPSSSATPTTKYQVIDGRSIVPNPWNPNRMTVAMYAKTLESIQEYGFVDPLTVRELDGPVTQRTRYQIIDGENRWRAGSDLGIPDFDCIVISGLTDAQAKKLTIVMNELHGQADPTKMGDLLTEILADSSIDEMLRALPYDESVVAGFLGKMPELPPLVTPPAPSTPGESKEPWTERLFKMPKSVALIVDEALEKAKDGEEIETWQALERVAADYLGS